MRPDTYHPQNTACRLRGCQINRNLILHKRRLINIENKPNSFALSTDLFSKILSMKSHTRAISWIRTTITRQGKGNREGEHQNPQKAHWHIQYQRQHHRAVRQEVQAAINTEKPKCKCAK
jgi:hypothetical protein